MVYHIEVLEKLISIDPNNLVASEVERRCRSTKSKYKDWQVIGEETNPTIKYEISGVPLRIQNRLQKNWELKNLKLEITLNQIIQLIVIG